MLRYKIIPFYSKLQENIKLFEDCVKDNKLILLPRIDGESEKGKKQLKYLKVKLIKPRKAK